MAMHLILIAYKGASMILFYYSRLIYLGTSSVDRPNFDELVNLPTLSR